MPILGGHAQLVVGADRDGTALAQARRSITRGGGVLATDATRLPFRAGAFQLVTSFETIEHLPERPAFVAELARVLSDDGVCFLSTPNARYTQPVNGKPRNPFHLHEYDPEELRTELQAQFPDVTLLGQSLNRELFQISPFYDDQQRLPRSIAVVTQLIFRRALQPMPPGIRNGVSRAVWGHSYYPRPEDYVFNDGVGLAPVTLAICRKRPAATAS